MRVIFLGSPAFAVPSLVSLAENDNIEVALVVTQPDRPAGRGRRLTPPPVKTAAVELRLPTYQPESLQDDAAVQILRDTKPDLLIVVAYGELLRRNVLELAPHGCLNIHPSLLPRYRGAAPIPAAILNGDAKTGVSVMKLVRKLDAGPIIAQQELDITASDTAATLGDRLARLAADLLPDVVSRYVAGELRPVPQDDDLATYTYEWTPADARIDWSDSADAIERLVRASNPWPIAWTTLNGERLRIMTASAPDLPISPMPAADPPGTVFSHSRAIFVITGTTPLLILEVQPAGKRPMPAADWWRGNRSASPRFDPATPIE